MSVQTSDPPTSTRGLAPIRVARAGKTADPARAVFWTVLAAILAQLTISSNLLDAIGIPYSSPGGLPFEKFHIATYLAALAVVLQARRDQRPLATLIADIRRRPAFPVAAAIMVGCAVFALLTAGTSGTAVYIESYVSAALLGFVMEEMDPADLRRIAYAMVAAFALNAVISGAETGLQFRLVPVEIFDLKGKLIPIDDFPDFRGNALYDNPLTGAMMTTMAVFLCLATDLRPPLKAAALGILLVGLMPFGGRGAMFVTYTLVALLAITHVLNRLAHRRMNVGGLALTVVGFVGVPALLAVMLFATPLGDRIATHFYADDSAEIRILQWHALDLLNSTDLLFGMNEQRLLDVMTQIGLEPPLNDIENFWLLVFLNLGVLGFALWLTGFVVILRRLWRAGGVLPRVILIATILVASGSNSLGRKSNVLFICVAAVLSAAAFSKPEEQREARAPGSTNRGVRRPALRDGDAAAARALAVATSRHLVKE